MIREEAIKCLKSLLEVRRKYGAMQTMKDETQCLDMAIKALEQEPCKDWYDVPSDEMTLGQARQAVRDLRKMWAEHLWQEPCGKDINVSTTDAISRQAVIEAIKNYASMLWEKYHEPFPESTIMEIIQALPPVTTRGELPSCESCMNGNQEEKAKLCQKSYLAGMEHSKQEPCEDAISRQAVLDKMKERDEELSSICPKDIKELPPVTPHTKMGRWIDGKCNRCGTHAPYWAMASTYYCSEYCPKCGTKMIEPQESEK